MIWLKAIRNCLWRGFKGLLVSILITAGILGASLLVLLLVTILWSGVVWLVGENTINAIGNWMETNIAWWFGGLILAAAAIPAWDSLVCEKQRLERKAKDVGNE